MEVAVVVAAAAAVALAIISSGDICIDTNSVRSRTARMGNNEASVTIPKPESVEFPLPAELAIPIPRASTRGTVTGPVVTAPT